MTSRIAELRAAAVLTQKGLADKAGLNIRHVQKLESGEIEISKMTLAVAVKLAEALNVKIEDLFINDKKPEE
jgi:transcriptional regulator with XRE-family HTH domain